MSNKRQRSEVWEHFDKAPDGERAICKYCGKSLVAISTRGTSHLKRHPCIKRLTGDVAQPVTLESNHEATNVGFTRDANAIWKYEVERAIRTNILFASSDYKKNWSDLTRLMDIEKEILKYYELEKEKLVIELKNLTSRVSFSSQIVKELGYISITAHFINEDFNLTRRLIGFKKLAALQSESCVVDAINSCISDWKLGDKIFTFVNSPFSYGMKKSLEECFSSKLLLNGRFIYNGCCKEAVTNFYTYSIGHLCYHDNSNIGKVVRHVKGAHSRMAIFNKLAGEKGFPPINIDWLNEYAGRSRDVDSKDLGHWKPALEMFKQALTYKDVFNQYAELAGQWMTVNGESLMLDNGHSSQLDIIDFSCPDTHVEVSQAPLSEQDMCSIDWERVEEAVHFSDFMLRVIDGLSTSNYPTSNLYFPHLMQIEDIIYSYVESIEIYLGTYFYGHLYHARSSDLFEIANVFDPRYKQIFTEYYCEKDNDPDYFNIDELRKLQEEIFCTYANEEMNEGSPECIENTNTQEQGPPCNSAHSIDGTFANKFNKYVKKTNKKENLNCTSTWLMSWLIWMMLASTS